MRGRFVQQKEIVGPQEKTCEGETDFFTAGKDGNIFVDRFAGESEAAEHVAQFAFRTVRGDGANGFKNRLVRIHGFRKVLRLVANFHAVANGTFAGREMQLIGENTE